MLKKIKLAINFLQVFGDRSGHIHKIWCGKYGNVIATGFEVVTNFINHSYRDKDIVKLFTELNNVLKSNPAGVEAIMNLAKDSFRQLEEMTEDDVDAMKAIVKQTVDAVSKDD